MEVKTDSINQVPRNACMLLSNRCCCLAGTFQDISVYLFLCETSDIWSSLLQKLQVLCSVPVQQNKITSWSFLRHSKTYLMVHWWQSCTPSPKPIWCARPQFFAAKGAMMKQANEHCTLVAGALALEPTLQVWSAENRPTFWSSSQEWPDHTHAGLWSHNLCPLHIGKFAAKGGFVHPCLASTSCSSNWPLLQQNLPNCHCNMQGQFAAGLAAALSSYFHQTKFWFMGYLSPNGFFKLRAAGHAQFHMPGRCAGCLALDGRLSL